MRIICPPVLIDGCICRIVSPIESLLEVEQWAGGWWEPSSVTLTTASLAPAASLAELEARGVPPEVCAPGLRSAEQQIQALMRATVSTAAQGSALDPANERRPDGARRRVYTGNARFRKGGAERNDETQLHEPRAVTPRGDTHAPAHAPRRRATDALPPQERSAP